MKPLGKHFHLSILIKSKLKIFFYPSGMILFGADLAFNNDTLSVREFFIFNISPDL